MRTRAETGGDELTGHPPGLRILVVEDHAVLTASLARYLHFFGHRLASAATLAEAQAALAGSSFDLVLADVYLPDGNSADLVPLIKEDSTIITISGFDFRPPSRLPDRWLAHLQKPYPAEELEALLQVASELTQRRSNPQEAPPLPVFPHEPSIPRTPATAPACP